jgi:ribosomal protein S18 acetylase RimI-like enzyme
VVDIRIAGTGDVDAIFGFGADIVPSFYAPLIGQQASDAHFEAWWNIEDISQSVRDQEVVVATDGNKIIGVGQYGILGDEYVIWKLYVHPEYRGQGIGVRLIDALIKELPTNTPHILIEHFAANERAGEFYEREGFLVRNIDLNAEGDHRADVVWRKRLL